MSRSAAQRDWDASLAIRAAWLHYAGGLTQAEVATRLGVSAVKAHRLVALANQSGAVKVSIDGEVSECLRLEDRLVARYGLVSASVVPDLGEPDLPLRALGIAGARFLAGKIEELQGGVIGVAHGRTLLAAIEAMPRASAGTVRFVSLMGGLTWNYAANPQDVMHRLADRTGGEAYVLPVPFLANSVADREVFLSQRGLREVFDLGARADLMVVGIGTAEPSAQLVTSRMIDGGEILEVRERGGVGEMLGHFFDAEGRPVETSLAARTLSPDLSALAGRQIVALAGGPGKVEAIRAVLRSGLLAGLITDERTAGVLAGDGA
jgi:DNA-binding transcriptional regulator LsrR (DeoR family)